MDCSTPGFPVLRLLSNQLPLPHLTRASVTLYPNQPVCYIHVQKYLSRLFTAAKDWKSPACPSINERMAQSWREEGAVGKNEEAPSILTCKGGQDPMVDKTQYVKWGADQCTEQSVICLESDNLITAKRWVRTHTPKWLRQLPPPGVWGSSETGEGKRIPSESCSMSRIFNSRDFLVVQQLRLLAPKAGARVWSLIRGLDSTLCN